MKPDGDNGLTAALNLFTRILSCKSRVQLKKINKFAVSDIQCQTYSPSFILIFSLFQRQTDLFDCPGAVALLNCRFVITINCKQFVLKPPSLFIFLTFLTFLTFFCFFHCLFLSFCLTPFLLRLLLIIYYVTMIFSYFSRAG